MRQHNVLQNEGSVTGHIRVTSDEVQKMSTGTWHVMVRGYAAFGGVSLVGSYTP